MKILIATGLFSPEIGGPATYSKILAEELPRRGFEVDVLSFGSVRYLPKIIRHFVYFLKCLRRGWKADLIFAQDPVSVGLPAALAAVILRKKFALKIVGDYAWEQFQVKNEKRKTKSNREKFSVDGGSASGGKNLEEFQNEKFDFLTELRRKIQKFVAGKTDKIIVPSKYLKKIVGEGWNMPEKKIRVIYNCVDNTNSVDLHPDNADRKYLLSIGRLVPWKGFEILIETMPELPDEIKLVIIGDGPEFKKLKISARGGSAFGGKNEKLKTKDRVEFIGRVAYSEMAKYFNQAKIFILNTAYEGLSHVILEAMQYGVPIITTDAGGNPELVKDGYNGILVEYNNKEQIKEAILKLWNDTELREKFVENSFKKLENFTKEKMLSQTIVALKI